MSATDPFTAARSACAPVRSCAEVRTRAFVSVLAVLIIGGCASRSTPPTVVGQPATVTSGSSPGASPSASSPPSTVAGASPTDPTTEATGVASAGRGALAGFHEVRAVVTAPDGTSRELCFLLADTEELRARGLMGVTELPGHDGMVFRFGRDQSAQFYMFQTVAALDVAFYDQAGSFVSATTMTPCTSTVASTCPLYRAGARYSDAVETLAGRASELALVSRSRLTVGGACPALG